MSRLLLHCGAHRVEKDQVYDVETPPVNQETGWTPIAHGNLIDTAQNAFLNHGYEITDEAHALTRHGGNYFGLFDIRRPNEPVTESCLSVGLRNSHTKMFALDMIAGDHLFICDNLAFSGQIHFARKHTRFILRDLPGLVAGAVGKLQAMRQTDLERFEVYKQTELKPRHADALIIEMLRTRIITTTQVGKVVAEWDKPSHEEFAEDGHTMWRLFNAATEALKGSLGRLPQATMRLNGLCDTACAAV